MALLLSVLEQGMIYGILALGVYITYKILDFPDSRSMAASLWGCHHCASDQRLRRTGDSLFPLHSSAEHWWNLYRIDPWKLKSQRPALGIIMMTGLYTINLWVAGSGLCSYF